VRSFLFAAILLFSGCIQSGITVKSGDTSLGKVLTDNSGFTLYVFTGDSYNQSNCVGVCAGTWPPLLATGEVSAESSISGTIGTMTRSDGTTQVTYNGMPLYRYSSDAAPGDVKGQGAVGRWYAATPGMMKFPCPDCVNG
jgi:predicted lipoprotein with Yx(FWY)xxD motif